MVRAQLVSSIPHATKHCYVSTEFQQSYLLFGNAPTNSSCAFYFQDDAQEAQNVSKRNFLRKYVVDEAESIQNPWHIMPCGSHVTTVLTQSMLFLAVPWPLLLPLSPQLLPARMMLPVLPLQGCLTPASLSTWRWVV